ncbi:hypothetical protein [Azospirillum argentinense]|uniref:hypothetical protein n=1 Tax=Azospirillum argentinense TaxID=2970906 RepID=UPI0032DF9897
MSSTKQSGSSASAVLAARGAAGVFAVLVFDAGAATIAAGAGVLAGHDLHPFVRCVSSLRLRCRSLLTVTTIAQPGWRHGWEEKMSVRKENR